MKVPTREPVSAISFDDPL